MASLRSRLDQGLKQLRKGHAEVAVEAFDQILAALGSGLSGREGQLSPEIEVDERTCEMDTIYVRNLRLEALIGCARWSDALAEIESLYQYSLHFGSPQDRLRLLRQKSEVAQRLGQRAVALEALRVIGLQSLGRDRELNEWAASQLQKLESLTGAQMAELADEQERVREARRQKRLLERQRKREEKRKK